MCHRHLCRTGHPGRAGTGLFRKAVPAIDGVIGGGVTFLTFKPCCDKPKASLRDTILSNPDDNPGTDDDVPVYTDELPFAEEDA